MSEEQKEQLNEKIEEQTQTQNEEIRAEQTDAPEMPEQSEDIQTQSPKQTDEPKKEELSAEQTLTEENKKLIYALQLERADFENYRKRNRAAVSEAMSVAKADVVKEILPVVDSLTRAFSTVTEDDAEDAFVKGMRLIQAQFENTLKKIGVKEIDAQGTKFDPKFHEAVMTQEAAEGQEENMVVEVLEKGYVLGDKVIRYSKVKVTKAKE